MRDLRNGPTQPVAQTLSSGSAWVKGLFRRAQGTRATGYGIMTVGWRFLAGPVSAILIVTRFSPELQGYYYTFASVQALQIFVELGFSNIVAYFASHEWAKLSLDPQRRIVGDADALSRLVSLGQATFRWYLMGGAIATLGIGVAGYVFFSQSPDLGIAWAAPWFALSILSGINLVLTPVWSLLEGCNQVSKTYSFRMVGALLSTPAAWAAIVLGAGLWTASVSTTVLLIWSATFLVWRYRRFFQPFFSKPTGPRVSWRREIWQVQWRTALSYLSGYFTSQVFTPVLFHYAGPVVAGQFGLTWSLIGAIGGVAYMWVSPRAPQFAMLIARKEYQSLDRLLYKIMIVFNAVMLLGAASVWTFIFALFVLRNPFSTRLLPPLETGVLLVAVFVANALGPTSVYLRAHKKEPYVALSIVLGILTALLTWLLGAGFAAMGVALAYLVVQGLVAMPWSLWIFYRYRRKWHTVTEG